MATICITGVTSGFGLATAKLFISAGWHVIGTGRRAERLNALKKEYAENFTPLCFDITHKSDVFQFLKNLDIDVLVNNAGLALGLEPAYAVDIQDWENMVDTNIKGLMYATRAVLPEMVKNKKGYIINIGSIAGTYPYPGGNVYGATKAFVEQFTLNLRSDLKGTNIRVSNIEPGLSESEFSIVRFKGDTEKASALYQNTHPITPEDIASLILTLVHLPPHINVNRLEVMPTSQSFSPLSVHKEI